MMMVLNTILGLIAAYIWASVYFAYRPPIQTSSIQDWGCEEVYKPDLGWTTKCDVNFRPKGGE